MINLELIRQEVVRALPVRARWRIKDTALDFDFTRSRQQLRTIAPNDLSGGVIESEWSVFYLFGQADFADGGGASPYLGVHQITGEICGIDVERVGSAVF